MPRAPTHLPGVEPLYTYGQNPRTLRAFVLQRVWQAGPPVYSDINFILLGIAIERLTGRALSEQPLPPGFTFGPDPARTRGDGTLHLARARDARRGS